MTRVRDLLGTKRPYTNMKQLTLNVTSRALHGRGPARRLRVEGSIPAIIYGKSGNQSVSVKQEDFRTLMRAKGTAAALRFEVIGMVNGAPAVVLEHITRLRDDLCPQWPQPAQEGGNYRIEITGEPCYALDLCLSSPNGDHNHAGVLATATRIVNAIPAVVAAEPGIRTTLDLPLITGKGLYAGT